MTFWCLYFKLSTYFTTSSSLPFVDFRYVFADRDTTEFIQKQYFNFIYNLWVVGVVYYCWLLISFIILYSPFRTLSFTHCIIYAENVFIINYSKGSTFACYIYNRPEKLCGLHPFPSYSMLIANSVTHSCSALPASHFLGFAHHWVRRKGKLWVPSNTSCIFGTFLWKYSKSQ